MIDRLPSGMGEQQAPRRRGAWLAAALALIAVGVAASVLGAWSVSNGQAQRARSAFRLTSSQIASNLSLALQREDDLLSTAKAALIESPGLSNVAFHRWGADEQVQRRYPEVLGITAVKIVPARELPAFAARELSDPGNMDLRSGHFQVLPPGERPYYCLSTVRFDASGLPPTPPGLDWCVATPGVLAARDSGLGTFYPISLGPQWGAALGIQVPVYREGRVPSTLSARRREFLGLIGMGIRPATLLSAALQGHHGVVAVLQRSQHVVEGANGLAAAPRFNTGRVPRGAARLLIRLSDDARLETFTSLPQAGPLGSAMAIAALAGGTLVSILLGLLVLVLGTDRARALRMVRERTRTLHERAARQTRIIETQRELSKLVDRGGAQQLICERALELAGGESATVWLLDGELLRREALAGEERLTATTLPLEGSLAERAMSGHHAGVVHDISAEPGLDVASAHGWKSCVAVPLAHGDRKVGVLIVISTETNTFGDEERQTLKLLAVMLSEFLSRAAEAEALARFEAVYRDAPIGIGILDLSGRYTETTNARLRDKHGVDELAGTLASDHVDPADRPAAIAGFERLLAGEYEAYTLEYRLQRADEHLVWVQSAVSLVRDAAGRPSFAVAMIKDITQRKVAELEQRQLEVETRMGQKLEAVGQLAAGIAHEMNTPIQFVGDSVRFLDDALRDTFGLIGTYQAAVAKADPETRAAIAEAERHADLEYVEERIPHVFERIYTGVERVSSLVKAMKDSAHSSQVEKAPADINQAIRTTLTVASNEYKYIADVQLELADLPPVVCNISDLNQVFLNLIVNAAHAIENSVCGSGSRGTIRIRTACDDDAVVVELSDDGAGIPANIRDRIFDPFFTTKEVGRGSGQGLAISYGIVVDRHGGTLGCTSELGVGTTFVLRLPIYAAAADDQPLAA